MTAAWDAQNPAATSTSSATINVFDSLGNSKALDIYFRKTTSNTWEWHAVAKSSDITGGVGTYSEVGSGAFDFSTGGALSTSTVTSPIAVNWTGAAAQTITANFGSAVTAGGSGLDGVTQFAGPFNVSSQSQDGYASGSLSGIGVDGMGTLRGMYSNGQNLPIGRLAIAKFQANEQLARAGAGMWIETRGSGSPALGTAGSGGRGAVSAGALELSNVDMAQQFVDLIAHQRAFEANSKTIATADEMLQSLQNLKR